LGFEYIAIFGSDYEIPAPTGSTPNYQNPLSRKQSVPPQFAPARAMLGDVTNIIEGDPAKTHSKKPNLQVAASDPVFDLHANAARQSCQNKRPKQIPEKRRHKSD
jgi:hypothetical protein